MLWDGSATASKSGDAEIEALSAAAFAGKAACNVGPPNQDVRGMVVTATTRQPAACAIRAIAHQVGIDSLNRGCACCQVIGARPEHEDILIARLQERE